METLNDECFCISLDAAKLRSALDAEVAGLGALIEARCPHLFAAVPMFVSERRVAEMARLIAAVEEVIALPAYRAAALARAPQIAHHDPGSLGVFAGYDFHLGADGPRLIEINSNAGGALLNAALMRAQHACCAEVQPLMDALTPAVDLERAFYDMFVAEWRRAGRDGLPRRVAIVDDAPQSQFLYPEFLLAARLFERFGVQASVLAPEQLATAGDVDLVYNRLTDFYLEQPAHAWLREAYLSGAAVVTPHPRAHALYADKRNLIALTDAPQLRAWGVQDGTIEVLRTGIPRTSLVSESLWEERRRLFFKPAAGHGSRAAYRGDKLTKRVWAEILQGEYVAQTLVAPGSRHVSAGVAMKADVRNYVYAGEVQMLAARLYQGQTTNMRTPGGGFAPVLVIADRAAGPGPEPVPGAAPARVAA